MKKPFYISRRNFVKQTVALSSGIGLANNAFSVPQNPIAPTDPSSIALHWLENHNATNLQGTTWGVPWSKGVLPQLSDFHIEDGSKPLTLQTWALAYWDDGSIKWTAHALAAHSDVSSNLFLKKGKAPATESTLRCTETAEKIHISTGRLQCEIMKQGEVLIQSILDENNKVVGNEGKLVLQIQNHADGEPSSHAQIQNYYSKIQRVSIEQKGPIRICIKIEGTHSHASLPTRLPFVVRLYFYEKAQSFRMLHSLVYDADEQQEFIKGIGLQLAVPLQGELYNRHIRFVAANQGIFAEAVQGLTGLRRNPGKEATQAQVVGKTVDSVSTAVQPLVQYIPAFGDYTLFQATPDAFEIQKRTKQGYGWIQSKFGHRATGTGYLGTPTGGLGFGIRNFWQSFPAQIDIRQAHTAQALVTLWLWAPKASAMDMRFYHDGMNQDTYEKQRAALDITYEDYEPEFGRPFGIARTSEIQLWALTHTPDTNTLLTIDQQIQKPALLQTTPDYLAQVGVFGRAFTPVQNPTATHKKIEEQLAFYFNYYQQQVEQHRWYGFWNYGDVMHTYDPDRHTWRYDVGGFAWDNSELSTDLWLWYYYLKTGKADVFRMAEAMTRHTGEVDVHHIGRFSPLGSRHNVQHWGCSAKQLRISTAANRRFYYYLTADERIGDLMREQLEAVRRLREVIPGRKIGQKAPDNDPKQDLASVSFGTDWGAIAAAWLTEWERTGNTTYKQKLLNSMQTIAAQPTGFFQGSGIMELSTGKFQISQQKTVSVSHLSAVFGLAEICFELTQLVDMPAFERAWLKYCELYNAPASEQAAFLGSPLPKLNLEQGHARLTAFVAFKSKNKALAKRAWQEFFDGVSGIKNPNTQTQQILPPAVLNPITEAQGVSTNAVSQWGLAAMQCLAFVGDSLE